MVADRTEETPDEIESKNKEPNTKEIPRWSSVANASCTRIHELICCEKVPHSILFYILVLLFLLIFVYILRKIVSFPGSQSKLSNGRKLNTNAADSVRNYSSSTLGKERPKKWPKIDKIVGHLSDHASSTTTSPINDLKTKIYGSRGDNGEKYTFSSFGTENPLSISGRTTTSKSGQQVEGNPHGFDMLNSNTKQYNGFLPKPQEDFIGDSGGSLGPNNAYASGQLEQNVFSWNTNDRFKSFPTVSSAITNNKNSGFGHNYNEWSNWDTWGDKTSAGSTTEYYSTSPSPDFPRQAWKSPSYSGFSLPKNSQLSEHGGSKFQNELAASGISADKAVNYKNSFNSLPWSKLDSRKPSGSGFGWVRSSDQDSQSSYRSYASFPEKNFYFDVTSGRWAYSGDNVDVHPTTKVYDNDGQAEQNNYDDTLGVNRWNTMANHAEISDTNYWNYDKGLNNIPPDLGASKDNKSGNKMYESFTERNDDELDKIPHRWPSVDDNSLKKFPKFSPDKNLSRNSVGNSTFKQLSEPKAKLRKHSKSFHKMLPKYKELGVKGRKKPSKTVNFVKKSKIPRPPIWAQKRRSKLKHSKEKHKLKLQLKSNLKSKRFHPLSKLKQHINRKPLLKSFTNKNKSKHLHVPLPSYAFYKNFLKRHQRTYSLVGKWRRKIHHVKKCKLLRTFKTHGKLKFKTQYLHNERKHKYTMVVCRSVDKLNGKTGKHRLNSVAGQVCREFWFITTGKIIPRKVRKTNHGNTYSLTLCKREINKVNLDESDDDDDVHEEVTDDGSTNDSRDQTGTNSDDDDNHDLDIDIDSDSKGDIKQTKRTNGLKKGGSDDNKYDKNEDNDEGDDELDLDSDENKSEDKDEVNSDKQEIDDDEENSLDDYSDDFEGNTDVNHRQGHLSTHQKSHPKVKKHKLKRHKSKPVINKSHKRKQFKKHFIRQKVKKLSTSKHKTISNKDKASDENNVLKDLLKQLIKERKTETKNDAMLKLIATFSHKNDKMKHSRKISQKKRIFHKRKRNKKKKKYLLPHTETSSVKNKMNFRTLLQNIISKSKDTKSLLHVNQKQSPKQAKRKKKISKQVTKHPFQQIDITGLLKAFVPSMSTKPTAIAPTTSKPTVQPTKENNIASNKNSQILEVLRKLGIKINKNASATDALESQPNKIKTYGNVETAVPSKSSIPSDLHLRRMSSVSPLTNYQNTLQDISLRSYIPKAEPIPTNPPTTLVLKSVLRSPTPSPISNNQRATTTGNRQPHQINNGYFGYSIYASRNRNPGVYESPSSNILCFGDSLTSGFYNHGRGKHPYSIRLNQLLNANGNHHYKVFTRGVVGEMAHGSMTKRLPQVLNEGTRFDWVLILGGTNDVAHVKNFGDDEEFTEQLISVWSPKIVKDIESLHQTAREYGARTVLMTIPETAYEIWPEFRSIRNMRLSVNAALRVYATQVKDTTVLCDLAIKLPRSSLSKQQKKLYWNDHIHLNPIGYDKMAEIIVQCIQPYLT